MKYRGRMIRAADLPVIRALIEEGMPVITLALNSHVHDKMLSNIEEVKARGGKVIAIMTEGNEAIAKKAEAAQAASAMRRSSVRRHPPTRAARRSRTRVCCRFSTISYTCPPR